MMANLLPVGICSKVDSALKRCWWGVSSSGKTRLALTPWDKICQPKKCGGLGLRKMQDMNRALLAKWGWLLLSDDKAIWANILRAKYLKKNNFLDVPSRRGTSTFWSNLLKVEIW